MTITAAASSDAFHSCAEITSGESVFWLQPRDIETSQEGRGRNSLSRLTASVGLSAFLTFASVGAAIGPAAALAPVEAESGQDDGAVVIDAALESTNPALANITPAEPDSDAAAASPPAPIDIALPPAPADFLPSAFNSAVSAVGSTLEDIAVVAEAPIPIPPLAVSGDAPSQAGPSAATDIVVQIDDRPPADPNELLSFDGMRVPRWIVDTILAAAEVTDVDPAYLMALADKESSFIPDIKARTSSAAGLFQFIDSTWLQMVRDFGPKYGLAGEAAAIDLSNGQYGIADAGMREHVLGLRRDAFVSALMAAEMMKRDRERIEQRIGRPISRSEYYLAHFFGVQSASRFMSLLDDKPKQSAPRVFPAAARANRALFFSKQGRRTRQLTVAEVYDRLDEMIDRRLERYEGVRMVAADASL
jgi:hypothetical protein